MKSFSIFLALLFSVQFLFAQDAPVMNTNAATANYLVGDLEKLDKLELTKIYISKVNRLMTIVPYIPFAKLEPKSPSDIKIPSNNANEACMRKLENSLKDHNQQLDASLSSLTPYADKKNIIESILFLQQVINKIELIGMGMQQSTF
ncbi:MAG: hypothetical protein NZ108_01695 [Bacteroidia bacterium]|nr:hypothetical protein [Bacteroidia bacterium]